LETVRVHDEIGFRLKSIKLRQESEDCWQESEDIFSKFWVRRSAGL